MSDRGDTYDARMDPWCLVKVASTKGVLFGYADWHPSTGGLAWTRSTPVVELDEAAGSAVTLSGRRYALGRRVEQSMVAEIGTEALLAFRVLVGRMPNASSAERLGDFDLKAAARWLTSCKMARHLGVSVPAFVPGEFDVFLSVNAAAYIRLRASQESRS